ncbi:MAG: hypothetical protein UW41_C0030G0001 [Candidatus Collierbacteria bacterium GW2011_GWC2_44_18]|uniref:Uncharacterized protein n=1 Tax=Candidatus Collierbacteria bacterium GW2011_GWC2_44_18 TaxID=1618392 RepID=A0A0G1KKD1_9BACT|nr:MAG: hypothetical protein UW41_C0030G0001 [Candidatus Collierbacteria bacterium GW2011_GWC2_44_18]
MLCTRSLKNSYSARVANKKIRINSRSLHQFPQIMGVICLACGAESRSADHHAISSPTGEEIGLTRRTIRFATPLCPGAGQLNGFGKHSAGEASSENGRVTVSLSPFPPMLALHGTITPRAFCSRGAQYRRTKNFSGWVGKFPRRLLLISRLRPPSPLSVA